MLHSMSNKQGHCIDVRDDIADKRNFHKCARVRENCCTFHQFSKESVLM